MNHLSQEKNIRGYLLGELFGGERERIEEQLLTDSEYFEKVLEIEDELTEQYLSGSLTRSERKKFESHFMSSPEQRESVRAAKELREYFLERLETKPEITVKERVDRMRWWSFFEPAFKNISTLNARALIVVGVLILFLCGVIYWTGYKNRQNEIVKEDPTQNEKQSVAAPAPDVSANKGVDETTPEKKTPVNENQPSRPDVVPEQPSQSQAVNRRRPQTSIITLALLAGQTMGGEVKQISLSRKAQVLRLKLYLEDESRESYRIELRTDEDEKIWSRDQIKPARHSPNPSLITQIPTNVLTQKDYRVIVSARLADNSYAPIGTYHFKVKSR